MALNTFHRVHTIDCLLNFQDCTLHERLSVNLVTWTSYTGYNPDVSSAGANANLNLGVDFYAYPLARTWTVGINAGW